MAAGCVVACGLALLPVLYVGSFAFLVADDWFGWGVYQTFDDRTTEVLEVVYGPLIWLYIGIMGIK
jgi:hypothetical protein